MYTCKYGSASNGCHGRILTVYFAINSDAAKRQAKQFDCIYTTVLFFIRFTSNVYKTMIEIEEIKDLINNDCISKVIYNVKVKQEKQLEDAVKNLRALSYDEELSELIDNDEELPPINDTDNVDIEKKISSSEMIVLPVTKSEVMKSLEDEGIVKYEKDPDVEALLNDEKNAEFDKFVIELAGLENQDGQSDDESVKKERQLIEGKKYNFDPKKHGIR